MQNKRYQTTSVVRSFSRLIIYNYFPLVEQHCIVVKVDAQLTTTQTDSRQFVLLVAVLNAALMPVN